MTPENLIIKDGFRTIRIDSYIEYLTNKPMKLMREQIRQQPMQ